MASSKFRFGKCCCWQFFLKQFYSIQFLFSPWGNNYRWISEWLLVPQFTLTSFICFPNTLASICFTLPLTALQVCHGFLQLCLSYGQSLIRIFEILTYIFTFTLQFISASCRFKFSLKISPNLPLLSNILYKFKIFIIGALKFYF